MQSFSKSYLRKKDDLVSLKDQYDKETENQAFKSAKIEEKNLVQFADKQKAKLFLIRSYSIVGLGFLTSSLTYPFAVRAVKRTLKFKNFFNVHFAIIPIILNVNAVVLGTAQAFFNYHIVNMNYG